VALGGAFKGPQAWIQAPPGSIGFGLCLQQKLEKGRGGVGNRRERSRIERANFIAD
jgi:hypothetical protein